MERRNRTRYKNSIAYLKADFHLTFFVRAGVSPKSEHALLSAAAKWLSAQKS